MSIQHAVKILSARRLAAAALKGLTLRQLVTEHQALVYSLEENLFGRARRIPLPAFVADHPCLEASRGFDLPLCSHCRVPMTICGLEQTSSCEDGLLLPMSTPVVLPFAHDVADLVVSLASRGEVRSVVFCNGGHQATTLANLCQQQLVFLTFNVLETSATYTEESIHQIFHRNP